MPDGRLTAHEPPNFLVPSRRRCSRSTSPRSAFCRSGNRLTTSAPPFTDGAGTSQSQDFLTFDFDERGGITASFLAKKPGPTTVLEPPAMRFSYQELGTGVLEAYERLFHDAMIGDKTLFASAPGIERLWEFAAALLDAPPPVRRYPQSGWGPEPAVDDLIAPRRWALP